MSYDLNPYGSPEKFGLTSLGEIQWGEACYDFDLTAVWRRDADGAFLYAEDSGCSCPSPFEDVTMVDLKPATPLEEFKTHLMERDDGGAQAADIAELLSARRGIGRRVERMHTAGAR